MLPITSLYAALCALLLIALTVSVIARRRALRVGLGSGNDTRLECRIRAHGNAVETVPIGLLLLLLLEIGGLPGAWLHAFGAALLLGRVLHAWGLSGHAGVSFGRMWGMLLTMLSVLGMAGTLLVRFLI